MKSLKKLAYIADKFEAKISKGQKMLGEDPKAVTADAFFDPGYTGKGEGEFRKFILGEGSNFLKALPQQVKTCNIGAAVDVPGNSASFLVSTTPPVPTKTIVDALNQDYIKYYGAAPAPRVMKKSVTKDPKSNKPLVDPTLKISHPAIITVT